MAKVRNLRIVLGTSEIIARVRRCDLQIAPQPPTAGANRDTAARPGNIVQNVNITPVRQSADAAPKFANTQGTEAFQLCSAEAMPMVAPKTVAPQDIPPETSEISPDGANLSACRAVACHNKAYG
jgi:hypothetical protein